MSCEFATGCAQNAIAVAALVIAVVGFVGIIVTYFTASVANDISYSMVPCAYLWVDVDKDSADNEDDQYYTVSLRNGGERAARLRNVKVHVKVAADANASPRRKALDETYDVTNASSCLYDPFNGFCQSFDPPLTFLHNGAALTPERINESIRSESRVFVIPPGGQFELLASCRFQEGAHGERIERIIPRDTLDAFINACTLVVEVYVNTRPTPTWCRRTVPSFVDVYTLPLNATHPGEGWVRRETHT